MSKAMAQERIEGSVAGRPKILIVEDDVAMQEILQVNLANAGYDVVVARDGVQAWLEFEKERPDLVTLDLNIPKMSGFRLIQLFKGEAGGAKGDQAVVPVIVVTGLDYEEAEEVAKAGADDFITKPFNPVELVEKVQAVLSRQS